MRVLLIGGTGYIGRSIAVELADRGHAAVVLARSAEARARITDPRIEVVDGALEDLAAVRGHAAAADGVVFLAATMTGATPAQTAAVDALLDDAAGTGRAFVLTSGLSIYLGVDAAVVTADTDTSGAPPHQAWRLALEQQVLAAKDRGVRSVVIRPSIVYGAGSASSLLLALLRHVAAGNPSFFIGDGDNRVPTVHVRDLAVAFVLALELAAPGTSYNVADGSILGFDLAHAAAGPGGAVVRRTVQEAVAAIGAAGGALAMDLAVSEWALVADLGWSPAQPPLAVELAAGRIPA